MVSLSPKQSEDRFKLTDVLENAVIQSNIGIVKSKQPGFIQVEMDGKLWNLRFVLDKTKPK